MDVSSSKIESSMSHLVSDNITNITATNFLDATNNKQPKEDSNPLKRLKAEMPKKGVANEDKPNRRGKSNLSTPIKLYISGRNLKNMDIFSKSDPLCVIFEKA